MKFIDQIYCSYHILRANIRRGYRIPLSVQLYLSDRCPNKCIYCNLPIKTRKRELSTQQVLHLIDQMANAGTKRLHLTGGEPMVREDIGEIIDYAKRRGIFIGISTSGSYIPQKLNALKDVDIVFISLDGEKEVNNFLRGENSFENAVESMELLERNKMKYWITSVISSKNKSSIYYLINFAKERKTLVNFQTLYFSNPQQNCHLPSKSQLDGLCLSNDEVKKVFRLLLREKKNGSPIGNSQGFFEYLLKWEDYQDIINPTLIDPRVKCWANTLFTFIDVNGLLYPCGVLIDRIPGYNVVELGFKEAFEKSGNKLPCKSCIAACHLETNLMFSLNLNTLWNWFYSIELKRYD